MRGGGGGGGGVSAEHVVLDIADQVKHHPGSSSLDHYHLQQLPGHLQQQQQQQQQQHAHDHHHFQHVTADLTKSVTSRTSVSSRKDSCEECRICQEEDEAGNLEVPCSCTGSLKYAHRKCVQRWCNEKGDTICEICQQPFQGYTTPATRHVQHSPTGADQHQLLGRNGGGGDEWRYHDPRLLAMAAERHFLQEYDDDYAASNATAAAWCRSAALILMTVLLVRQTLTVSSNESDEDVSTFFTLFILRAAGFLLPCYILARILNVLQRRRQRQEWSSARSFQLLDPSLSHSQRLPFLASSRV